MNPWKFYMIALLTILNWSPAPCQTPQPRYHVHVVAQPGTQIGDHVFTADTTINRAVLNDDGDVAFLCHWTEGKLNSAAVFTAGRMVLRENDTLDDGSYIVMLPDQAAIAINEAGLVAIEGLYTGYPAGNNHGIFVNKHIVVPQRFASLGEPFTLTEDGRVSEGSRSVAPETPEATAKKKSILDHLHIKTPQLPKGIPFSITASSKPETVKELQQPKPSYYGMRPDVITPSPEMAVNHRGVVLVSLNLGDGFIVALLAPVSH